MRRRSSRNILLYIHTEAGDDLVVRPVNSFEYRKLQRGVYDPFWSPDGRQIGFFKDAKLKRMSVNGGSAQTIVSTGDSRGASWGSSGVVAYSPGLNSAILAVPVEGGTPKPVTKLDASRKEVGHWRPFFLPDGRHFLFTAQSSDQENSVVWCGSLDSLERKRVLDLDTTAIYADGHLLYIDGHDLYAVKFDADKIAKTGEPFVVVKSVSYSGQYGSAGFSGGGGTLVYQLAAAAVNPPIARFDRQTRTRTILPDVIGGNLDLSRDDTRLAVQRVNDSNTPDIWITDLARGSSARITSDSAPDVGPVWSPDSLKIAYISMRNGNISLLRKLASGAGAEETLASYPPVGAVEGGLTLTEAVDWSRDGRYIIAELSKPGEAQNVGMVDAITPGKPLIPLVSTPFAEHSARISPDGRWLAYVSNENGARQIYVEPFPPTGARMQVSIDGGESPRWRGDSRELYFADRDRSILAVQVTPRGTEADFSKPVSILDGAAIDYVVSSDGKTFYASLQRPNIADPVYVVTNWTAGR
jgi:Tol biopolymer transport system component